MYCVYKHTSPNSKVYIGITSLNPIDRWRSGKGYKNNPHFWNAIVKYGWDNFKHEILFTDLSKEEAEQKEIELIALYKSNNPEFGYNIENGGSSNGKHSEETLRKMSERRKGKCVGAENPFYNKHHPQEWIDSHLKGCNNPMYGRFGKNHPRYGIKHTNEAVEKMKIAKKGKYVGGNNPRAIKVKCVETGQIFMCMDEAAKWVHGDRGRLSIAVKNKKPFKKYHWEVIVEDDKTN